MKSIAEYWIVAVLSVSVTLGMFSLSACSQPAEEDASGQVGKRVTTASGLTYEILESGKGATPNATDKVTLHYSGALEDGTEFQNSYKDGEPVVFPVSSMVKGCAEALQLMKEGDKWRLTIPPDLGFGAKGAGSKVPPNATLIFEVQLIKVH